MKKYIDMAVRWLVYIYISILPWIIFRKELLFNTEEKKIMPVKTAGNTDYFLYGKAAFTIAVGILLFILLFVEITVFHEKLLDFKTRRDRILFGCMGIYIVCTVMSTILADYKKTALSGGVNSCEGMWVLLLYPVLFLAAKFVFEIDRHKESTDLKQQQAAGKWSSLEWIVLIQAVILWVLSVIELLYQPVVQLATGHETQSPYVNMISLSFPSPAYCAGYIVLLAPFCMYFMVKADSLLRSVMWSVLTVTTVTACFLTRSTAGFYLVIAEGVGFAVYAVVWCKPQTWKMPAVKAVSVAAVISAVFLMNMAAGRRIGSAASASAVNQTTPVHKSDYYKVKQIEVQNNEVIITGEENTLICRLNEKTSVSFTDENENVLNVSSENGSIYFPEPYEMICAGFENNALWLDLGYKDRIRFYIAGGKFYPMAADGSLIRDISSGMSKENTRFDSIITGRGYIWRKTVPVLKNTALFGHGAGTFAFYFKQFDYAGLLNSQGEVDLMIDRPHSWYLQMACSQGIFCMMAVVALIATVCVSGIKRFTSKKPELKKGAIDMAAVTAIIAFCIFEGITDGSVSVNPLLWVVLGGLTGR